jgi:hypothetical protein
MLQQCNDAIKQLHCSQHLLLLLLLVAQGWHLYCSSQGTPTKQVVVQGWHEGWHLHCRADMAHPK